MLPGVFPPKSGFKRDSLLMGQKWGIRVLHGAKPFAVGLTVTSALSIEGGGMKGKALQVVHHFGDELWLNGSKAVPGPEFNVRRITAPAEPQAEPDFDVPEAAAVVGGAKATDAGEAAAGGGSTIVDQNQVLAHVRTRRMIRAEKGKAKGAGPPRRPRPAEDDDGWGDDNCKSGPDGIDDLAEDWEDDIADDASEAHLSAGGADVGGDPQTAEPTTAEPEIPAAAGEAADEGVNGEEAEEMLPRAAVDFLLHRCLLEALVSKISDGQLPLEFPAVYSQAMAAAPYVVREAESLRTLREKFEVEPSRVMALLRTLPISGVIGIHQSSHKKLPKWIKSINKTFIECKDNRGNKIVTRIIRSHPDYVSHVPLAADFVKQIDKEIEKAKKMETAAAETQPTENAAKPAFAPPAVHIYYRLLGKCRGILAGVEGVQPSEYLTKVKALEVLESYLANNNLRTGANVRIDATLSSALSVAADEEMQLAAVKAKYVDALEISHAIVRGGSNMALEVPKLVKGPVTPITVSEEVRQGKKYVTTVQGIDSFHMNAPLLVEVLSQKCASTASFLDNQGKKGSAKSGVLVQGKQAREVAKILVRDFGVPQIYVTVVRK